MLHRITVAASDGLRYLCNISFIFFPFRLPHSPRSHGQWWAFRCFFQELQVRFSLFSFTPSRLFIWSYVRVPGSLSSRSFNADPLRYLPSSLILMSLQLPQRLSISPFLPSFLGSSGKSFKCNGCSRCKFFSVTNGLRLGKVFQGPPASTASGLSVCFELISKANREGIEENRK